MLAFVLLLIVWVVVIPVGMVTFLLAYPAYVRRRAGVRGGAQLDAGATAAHAQVIPLVRAPHTARDVA